MKNKLEKDNLSPSNIINRLVSETPSYWKKIRNWSAILASVGAVVLTLPVSLPAVIITGAGYAVAVGTVVATVSQTAKK